MSKNKTLKKVIAFSSALVISSSLLTGCGADPPQEQYRDSDKEDITIVNHDSGSFSDFLAGTIVGTWLNSGTYNNRNYNEGNGSYNSRSYSRDSNLSIPSLKFILKNVWQGGTCKAVNFRQVLLTCLKTTV